MSRLGKLPIKLVPGVQFNIDGGQIVIKGSKGELKQALHPQVKVELNGEEIIVTVQDPTDKKQRALWGLFRNLVENMVVGVSQGFERRLEIKGVGYRAAATGSKLTLNLGFSHPIEVPMPQGVSVAVDGSFIILTGCDKQLLGEIAAQIRKFREPEPYKGKGIKYVEETIRRKAGKTAASK